MYENPKTTAAIAGHPIHHILVGFPIAFWFAALATDIAYVSTRDFGWSTASIWLVGAGVVMALLAALPGFIDFFGDHRVRALRDAWRHMIGNLVAVALAALSWGLRLTQGSEVAVLPWGLVLSAAVAAILLYTGWKGGELAYRHRVGVREAPSDAETASDPVRTRERV
jgi:uncharacterized membrane protein